MPKYAITPDTSGTDKENVRTHRSHLRYIRGKGYYGRKTLRTLAKLAQRKLRKDIEAGKKPFVPDSEVMKGGHLGSKNR